MYQGILWGEQVLHPIYLGRNLGGWMHFSTLRKTTKWVNVQSISPEQSFGCLEVPVWTSSLPLHMQETLLACLKGCFVRSFFLAWLVMSHKLTIYFTFLRPTSLSLSPVPLSLNLEPTTLQSLPGCTVLYQGNWGGPRTRAHGMIRFHPCVDVKLHSA